MIDLISGILAQVEEVLAYYRPGLPPHAGFPPATDPALTEGEGS